MEKIYNCKMKSITERQIPIHRSRMVVWMAIFTLILTAFSYHEAYSQVRAGAAFLKMFPGARTQSMGSIHTGALDDSYALFMNPGTGSYLRDWQWSAGYTKWFADIYSASFVAGKKFSFPWSRKTYMGLSFLYLGVPEFDSTDDEAPVASANEMLFSFHLGQPLNFIDENISLGVNVKYLNSKLDSYEANSLIFDAGLLAKTRRINLHNSLFNFGYLAIGGSLLNYGEKLNYDQEGTPLHRMWRVGPSLYLGTHNGIQLQILADYYNILDEGDTYGIGAELSVSNLFHLSGGYNFGNDLLNKVSFGLSIRLDDVLVSEKSFLPGKNKGLRIDLSSIGEGEFFSNVYEGSLSHIPILPESYRLNTPANNDTIYASETWLEWEKSTDPDLYDDVNYSVIVVQDSQKLATMLRSESLDFLINELVGTSSSDSIFARKTKRNRIAVQNLAIGEYYWAVIAHDLDNHMRLGKTRDNSYISKFTVVSTDIEVKMIAFDYSRQITTDDYHGELTVQVFNNSMITATEIEIAVHDSLLDSGNRSSRKQLYSETIPLLEALELQEIDIPWHTLQHGKHEITAEVRLGSGREESNTANNRLANAFYTIPKGTFICPDTVQTLQVSIVSIDLPIITIIAFDRNSAELKSDYYQNKIIESPLMVLTERMREDRALRITLKGYIDPNSDETDLNLADRRANTIKNFMVEQGVLSEQVKIIEGESLPYKQLPANEQDARWIREERRHVSITADDAVQKKLLKPVRHVDQDVETLPIEFTSKIVTALPNKVVSMFYKGQQIHDSLNVILPENKRFPDVLRLSPAKEYLGDLLKNTMTYSIRVVDEEGRTFFGEERATYLDMVSRHRKHRFAFPLQFADTNPIYNFYWDHIADHIKYLSADIDNEIVFEGHACEIGPERINEDLSLHRAITFREQFLGYIRDTDPNLNKVIVDHLRKNHVYGEMRPLRIEHMNGDVVIIGDNNSALGRMLNRRIEILFSLKD